ncbi:acyltransferase [Clostridium beijerinckii]|nr:DapH/DapD/GlmU-related protein [Clostridium beijerinckii]
MVKILKDIKKKIKNKIREHVTTEELMANGMKVGKDFFRGKNTELDDTFCWLIEIGDNVTLAPSVIVLAHDASMRCTLGYTKVGMVKIGNRVFVGASSIILPGVTIGDNVIIGAGSVVTKNIPSNSVYGGNPAKKISDLETYLSKHKDSNKTIFDEKNTFKGKLTLEEKHRIRCILEQEGISYSR